jgi:hypothetical protein
LAEDAVVYLLINNRAGGNAPLLAQKVAEGINEITILCTGYYEKDGL